MRILRRYCKAGLTIEWDICGCTSRALSSIRNQGVGVLTNGKLLIQSGIQEDNLNQVGAEADKKDNDGSQLGSRQCYKLGQEGRREASAVSGSVRLPTVSQRLAQRIWDLDFIEMEEFLPSNRTVQALEISRLAREGGQLTKYRRVAKWLISCPGCGVSRYM